MPSATPSATLRDLALELDHKLGRIFAALQPLIAHHFLRHAWVHFSVTIPLCNRFSRYARRFSRLMAGIAAGRLPAGRSPRARPSVTEERPVNRKPRPAIPRQRGWMLKAMGYHVALYRNHLQALLAEPAMVELLAVAPGAGRIIRPLCHMLLLPPPGRPRPSPPSPTLPAPQATREPPREPSPREPAAAAPPRPVNTAPFCRSLTLQRLPYICTHVLPT